MLQERPQFVMREWPQLASSARAFFSKSGRLQFSSRSTVTYKCAGFFLFYCFYLFS